MAKIITKNGIISSSAEVNIVPDVDIPSGSLVVADNITAGAEVTASALVFTPVSGTFMYTSGGASRLLTQNPNGASQTLFVGRLAGNTSTTAAGNTFLGHQAGTAIVGGTQNTFVGAQAGEDNASGFSNVYVGRQAGKAASAGNDNVYVGTLAGRNNTGGFNVIIGSLAGESLAGGGSTNVIIGSVAALQATGSGNVIIGQNAGRLQKGNNNVLLGPSAGYDLSGSNTLIIGDSSGSNIPLLRGRIDSSGANNKLGINLGQNIEPTETLHVSGALRLESSNASGSDNGIIRYTGTDFEGRKGGSWVSLTATGSGGGSGDVTGPSSATDNGVAVFDGTTGKIIKNQNIMVLSGTTAQVTGTMEVSGAAGSRQVILTNADTIATNAAQSNSFKITLTGSAILGNPTNVIEGFTYMWTIQQDLTGSRTLTYGSSFKFPGGTAPTLSTATSSIDVISGYCHDGTNLLCTFQSDFK